MTPPHGGYPQPHKRKPLSIAEHKEQVDWVRQDIEAGDDMLHDMLCVIYSTPESQNN